DVFVLVNHGIALATLDGDRNDLVLEPAGLLRGFRLVLALRREFVLHLAGDLELPGDILGRVAHVVAVEGIPQPVADHRVDEAEIAHLVAGAQIGRMRRLAHAFLAASDHDAAVAVHDRLPAKRDRAQARAAELVDAPGRHFHRQAGIDRGLTGRILALRGRKDLAHDHFADVTGSHAGALQRALDPDLPEIMGRHAAERTVERADRRARGSCDNDLRHG